MVTRRVEVAPYSFTVTFTTDIGMYCRLSQETKADAKAGLGWTASNLKAGKGWVVAVLDGSHATLVHECVHLALWILDRVGIDPRDSSGESMAYLTDWLYTQGCKVLEV